QWLRISEGMGSLRSAVMVADDSLGISRRAVAGWESIKGSDSELDEVAAGRLGGAPRRQGGLLENRRALPPTVRSTGGPPSKRRPGGSLIPSRDNSQTGKLSTVVTRASSKSGRENAGIKFRPYPLECDGGGLGITPSSPPQYDPARHLTIAIEGCAHGDLDRIYEAIEHLEQTKNTPPVDLLICCGDFQAIRTVIAPSGPTEPGS
ncbi:hypothetical protein FOZ63_012434, partial [Perkinsus olseni]